MLGKKDTSEEQKRRNTKQKYNKSRRGSR
jgi:hypothetical protein